jgi:hypothetical protein
MSAPRLFVEESAPSSPPAASSRCPPQLRTTPRMRCGFARANA